MSGIVPDGLYDAQEEAFRQFEDYRDQLINENGFSRNQALCEAYNHLAVLWYDDILQQAQTKEEAEYCKKQGKRYDKLSDRYCDKDG